MNTSSVLGTVPGTRDTTENKVDKIPDCTELKSGGVFLTQGLGLGRCAIKTEKTGAPGWLSE